MKATVNPPARTWPGRRSGNDVRRTLPHVTAIVHADRLTDPFRAHAGTGA